ncbi:hypothetical protein [Nocardia sp. NPDC049707]|uniref:hypothetical protein n=1 Tax=Nocardia sp. NPDC049707 TaxID=3154735 RepID=UPI003438CF0F
MRGGAVPVSPFRDLPAVRHQPPQTSPQHPVARLDTRRIGRGLARQQTGGVMADTQTVAAGSEPIVRALFDPDGPAGSFFDRG